MNDNTTIGSDQTEEEILTYEVSDEALETAAATGKEMANPTIPPIWCPDT
jgi:hypothetical protein